MLQDIIDVVSQAGQFDHVFELFFTPAARRCWGGLQSIYELLRLRSVPLHFSREDGLRPLEPAKSLLIVAQRLCHRVY